MRHLILYPLLTTSFLTSAASAGVVEDWFLNLGYDDAEMSWNMRSSFEDGFEVENLSLAHGPLRLSAARLRVEGEGFQMSNVTVVNVESGDGFLEADSLLSTDSEIFTYLTEYIFDLSDMDYDAVMSEGELVFEDPPFCKSLQDGDESEAVLMGSGVRLVADAGSLPVGYLTSETIQFSDIRITEGYERIGETCHSQVLMEGWAGQITAIDGARITLGNVTQEVYNSWSSSGFDTFQEVSTRITDAALFSAEGVSSARFDEMRLSLSKDNIWGDMLCLFFDEMASTSKLVTDAFSKGEAGVQFSMKNLNIDTDDFFGPELVASLGIEGIGDLAGDVSILANLKDGKGVADVDIDVSGLLKSKARVDLSFPEHSGSTLPGFISERLPIPGEILDVEIVGVDIAHEDRGFSELMERLMGVRASGFYEKYAAIGMSRLGGKIPDFVKGKVDAMNAGVVGLLDHGGTFEVAPEAPQKVLTLAMQAMMNPQGLTQALGVDLQINEPEKAD